MRASDRYESSSELMAAVGLVATITYSLETERKGFTIGVSSLLIARSDHGRSQA